MHLLKEYANLKEEDREVFLDYPSRQDGSIVSYIIEKNDQGEELIQRSSSKILARLQIEDKELSDFLVKKSKDSFHHIPLNPFYFELLTHIRKIITIDLEDYQRIHINK